jgi:hypothetical protein
LIISLFYSLGFKKLFFAVMPAPLIARSGPNPAGGLAALVILKTLGEVFAAWAGRIRGLEFKSAAMNACLVDIVGEPAQGVIPFVRDYAKTQLGKSCSLLSKGVSS